MARPAIDELYRARFDDAVRLAWLLTGNASIAEDLAQDSFERVGRCFDGIEAPWAYLRATIVNACRTYHRTAARDAARARFVGTSPVVQLQARELLDAIDRLPDRQKAVIVLRYYEDLSEREIAAALGVRPGTVKSLASRALDHLATAVPR